MGVTFPIIPGLKILTSYRQMTSIPKNFHTDIPDTLVQEFMHSDPKHHAEIGVNFSLRQCMELLEFGAPCLHFYIMQDTRHILTLLNKLKVHA